jgi:hypothetical protein
VARYCAGMGRLWFAVTLRLAGQGLGWAVPALAFVCLVLAVIAAATRLLPNRITYPAFPVVPGCCWPPASAWASLAGSVAACSRRPRSAGYSGCWRCWLPTAWGGRWQAGPDLGPGGRLAVVGDGGGGVVAGFLLGGLAGLGGMLALGLSRTSLQPFGPWLVGALLGILVGGEVAGWFQASSLGAR